MYKELFILAIGFILGMIAMWFVLKNSIGDEYKIDADIKNKKGNMIDNIFKGTIDSNTRKKEGLIKRLRNKRLIKKQKL